MSSSTCQEHGAIIDTVKINDSPSSHFGYVSTLRYVYIYTTSMYKVSKGVLDFVYVMD